MKKKVIIIVPIIIIVLILALIAGFNKKDVLTDNARFKVEITGNDTCKIGDEIVFNIKLKDLGKIGGSADGICILLATLTYDENQLEKIEAEGLNGFTATWGPRIVIDNSIGVNSDTEIASFKFKVKETAKSGETTISLTDVVGSNSDEDISSNNFDKTIKIVK